MLYEIIHLKHATSGNSLVILWLGCHTSTAGGTGHSLVGELRSCSRAKQIKNKICHFVFLPFISILCISLFFPFFKKKKKNFYFILWGRGGFPGDSAVKNPLTMQETQVRSLGQEDPLEEGMATHSSIFAWRIPWTEEPGGLQSVGSQRVRQD